MALKVGELYATLKLDDGKFSQTLKNIVNNFNGMADNIENSVDDIVEAMDEATESVEDFEDTTSRIKKPEIPAPDTSKFDKTLKSVSDKLVNVGSKMSALVTAPIVGVGTAATMTGMSFEQAMANVQAITNATGKDFSDLEAKAKEMGASTKFSATQSADAMSYLGMAGWDTTQILAGIEPVLQLSIASGSELATVADIVSDALTGFGMSAEETGRFTDILAQVSRKANTNVEILGESFKYSASLMGSMGYNAEDTAIALGIMANAGIKGSSAGTALSAALSRLIDPTKEVSELMNKYGISLTDTDGNMYSLGEMMEQLRAKLGGLDTATKNQVVTQLFGQEAMKGMLPIINASEDSYNSLKDAIYGSSGAANEMATIMGDTLQGRVDGMKSAIEGGLINVFEQLQPKIETLVEKITELATWLANADQETIDSIINWGLFLAAIGPVLTIVGKGIQIFLGVKKALGLAKGAMLAWTGATTVAGAASTILGGAVTLLSGPFGVIIAIIAGVVAAGVALWKNWDWVSEKAGQLGGLISKKWEEIKTACVETWNKVGEYLVEKWNSFVESAKQTWDNIKNGVIEKWTEIKNKFSEKLQEIKDKFSEIWDNITSFLSTTWETLGNIVQVGILLIKEILNGAFQILMIPFNFIWENFGNTLTEAWEKFSKYLSDTWDNICQTARDIFTPILDFYKNTWTSIYDTCKQIWETITSWLTSKWESICSTVTQVWTNIKTAISEKWNEIKNKCTEVWNSITSFISEKWNAIATATNEKWNEIKSKVVEKWNGIKNSATEKFNAIKDTVSTKWNEMKTGASTKWEEIKSNLSTKWESVKSTAQTKFNSVKSTVSGVWDSMKTSASTKWDSIKSTISDKWEGIKTTVQNGVKKIKDAMNFNWSLPKLKLPHFKISGKFSLNPPSVPSFGVEWYKRGGMFDSPTVVGLGEAGREGIVPFSGMSNKSLANELAQLFADAGGFGGGSGVVVEQMVVRDDTDIIKIAQELDRLQRRNSRGRR